MCGWYRPAAFVQAQNDVIKLLRISLRDGRRLQDITHENKANSQLLFPMTQSRQIFGLLKKEILDHDQLDAHLLYFTIRLL